MFFLSSKVHILYNQSLLSSFWSLRRLLMTIACLSYRTPTISPLSESLKPFLLPAFFLVHCLLNSLWTLVRSCCLSSYCQWSWLLYMCFVRNVIYFKFWENVSTVTKVRIIIRSCLIVQASPKKCCQRLAWLSCAIGERLLSPEAETSATS